MKLPYYPTLAFLHEKTFEAIEATTALKNELKKNSLNKKISSREVSALLNMALRKGDAKVSIRSKQKNGREKALYISFKITSLPKPNVSVVTVNEMTEEDKKLFGIT